MADKGVVKCRHRPCKCLVESDELYCGEACAALEHDGSTQCPCGHAECSGPEEAAIEDPVIDEIVIGDAEPDLSPT